VLLAAPPFAFLDRPRSALASAQVVRVLRLLAERSITYLTVGNGADDPDDYDAILELGDGGEWTWRVR